LIKDPPDASRFAQTQHLDAIEKTGLFKEQVIAIAPIRSGTGPSVENDPLLTKDIRFFFEPNEAKLDMANQANLQNLEAIKKMLQVSPGSTMLLRGHVDDAQVAVFRAKGGDAYVRQMALKAMELSKNRASEIRRLLIERHSVDAKRLDIVGRGWEEPAGKDSALNRRVEVHWFTIE
jgi:NitT/TauT family transport system substrate-binding protein